MFIVLSNASDIPLYEQIVTEIKAKILASDLKPGDPLPSIRQLAADLTISVITTKRAYQELEQQGFIETRPGKGSFVSQQDPALVVDRRLEEVSNLLRNVIRDALRMGLLKEEFQALVDKLLSEEEEAK